MAKKKILILGSGGREHAIAHFIRASEHVDKIYCAPGNAGMGLEGELVALDPKDHKAILTFVQEKNIYLTIIGPEAPLVAGLADALRAENHLVVGPSQKAAQLEGSKIFAKKFMDKYGIPTAPFKAFDNADDAKKFAQSQDGKDYLVLKADGLAAGKGVFVNNTTGEVLSAINQVMVDKKFGDAGSHIILEKKLLGPEVSVMGLTDGKTLLPFAASQDHKRAYDGDNGPNTGGMGAYAPTPFYNDSVRVKVQKDVIDNFIRGLKGEDLDYRGIIYVGLILTQEGPQVLEFNVRLGDPEAQVILSLVDTDLFDKFEAVAQGDLGSTPMGIKAGAACTVVMSSGGYPGSYEKGFQIRGLDQAQKKGQVYVFHAGTEQRVHEILTNGGRVLNVTGVGADLETAVVRAYQGVKKISFKNAFFRHDIASRAVDNKDLYQKIKRMRNQNDQELELSRS
jgi:phosphoribosylamine--glycine ligase